MVRFIPGSAVVALVAALTVPATTHAETTTPPSMRVLVKPVDVGERPRLLVEVPVPSGVDDPSGAVIVEVTGGDYRVRRSREWSGRDVAFVVARVAHPGRYVVRALFHSTNERMADQSASRVFRVTTRN